MAITFDKALGIHDAALRFRSQRAEVLANNLANTDTPNYKARDLDFQAALRGEMQQRSSQLNMATTRSGHIGGRSMVNDDPSLLYRIPTQPSIDGNTVDDQVEHAQFMQNAMDFQASYTFLNSKFKGLTRAIKGD